MEKLKLPKKDRPTGLFLYCNGCKKHYISDAKVKCKCNKLVYKARVHVTNTKRLTKNQILETTDFIEALQMFHKFKQSLILNSFQKVSLKKVEVKPVRLLDCFAYYIGFLNNIDVPKHKHRDRSKKALSAFDYSFKLFKEALELNNIDCKILKFIDVNDEMVGYVHEYLLVHKKYANKTYNNIMSNLSQFTTHVISKFRLDYVNLFLGVEKLYVEPKNETVQSGEFSNFLKLVKQENGYKKCKRLHRTCLSNLYRPWLKEGFLLGLFTGGRNDEVAWLQWSGISVNENGTFKSIKVTHFKANKANSHLVSEKDKIIKEFTITKELGNLLIKLGYNSKKTTSEYILAPERQNRKQIASELSRAFSHFYKKLGTGREITFKNLRKTFITSAVDDYGMGVTALTGHKNISVIHSNYYDKKITQDKAQKSFSVFKKKKK